MDSLGDRIKGYEKVFSYSLPKKIPVMIRVDGRAFHTFTRNLNKPFDSDLMRAMIFAAIETARQMQGFTFAYIQSDEVTFLLNDYKRIETDAWFDYDLSKLVSITAATMSIEFNIAFKSSRAIFDGRAFAVPREDVINAFLWRAKDWERNSLQMYCRSFFSHKQLDRKNRKDMHEMLHRIGKNWTEDLSDAEKNGTFILNSPTVGIIIRQNILPTFQDMYENLKGYY